MATTHHDPSSHKDIEASAPTSIHSDHGGEDAVAAPAGVNRIAAFYSVFSRPWKVWAFWIAFMVWLCAYSLSADTTYIYLQFATSSFSEHTLVGTIAVVVGLVGAIVPPFYGKLADFVSRPSALILALTFYTVGYAAVAASKNVQTVAAGQVLYQLGNSGMDFIQTLIIADITSLQNRGLTLGAVSLPYIVFAFVAPSISDGIGLENWPWGYGMFCILMPICVAPIALTLIWADRKARKNGTVSVAASSLKYQLGISGEQGEQKSLFQQILHALNVIDALGLLLMGFTFAMLLAPTTLSTTASNGWKNPSLIAMQTVGGILFIVWCVWEWRFAQYPIMPKRIMNRTFLVCLVIDFFGYVCAYLTDIYWSSWLYVIKDYSTRDYTYMQQIETISLCLFGFIAGLIMRYTHRYKVLQIISQALRVLGLGLTYYACYNNGTAAIFFGKMITSLGGGFAVVASQVAAQSSVKHSDLALAVALLSLWTRVGGGIGSAISASVWNAQLPAQLAKHVPSLSADEITNIFGSIDVARTSEPRDQIIKAYNETYRLLAIPALVCMFVPLAVSFFARDYKLDEKHNAIEETRVLATAGPGTAGRVAAAEVRQREESEEQEDRDGKSLRE